MSSAERILAATEAELLKSDPGSLRVDRVAQAAAANKRMIYHYFGDRSGLIEAVYARQLQILLTPGPAVSASTRRVIRLLLTDAPASAVNVQDLPVANTADAVQLQRAARVLLPYLLNQSVPRQSPRQRVRVPAGVWVSFCVELLSLAFVNVAPVQFPEEPGTEDFAQLSERLLTPDKPKIRIRSDSRAHGTEDAD
jgi:AcrR family transcriptional regulator